MEKISNNRTPINGVGLERISPQITDRGEWTWVRGSYGWEAQHLPSLPRDGSAMEEGEKRKAAFLEMLSEMKKTQESLSEHNEGFLRDHPRYKELFIKWAFRYLHKEGYDLTDYNGEVSTDGNLLDASGYETTVSLTDLVSRAREWIDEYIEYELWNTEQFEDITNDWERRSELDIYPQNDGWYNKDRW